jgi:hypothetical protein
MTHLAKEGIFILLTVSGDAGNRLLAARRRPSVRSRTGQMGLLRRMTRQRHSSHQPCGVPKLPG